MAAEQFANNAQSTLNGALDNSQLTLVVTSAASFPTQGNFRVLIDSEIMLVTGVSGSTFTVTRGAESTTPATHSNGATVTQVVTKAVMIQAVTPPACRVGRNASKTISNAIETNMDFNIKRFDTDSMFTTGASNDHMTVQTPGLYSIGASFRWKTTATGQRFGYIKVGNLPVAQVDCDDNDDRANLATLYQCTSAVAISLIVYQNTGGNLGIVSEADYTPELWAIKVGEAS